MMTHLVKPTGPSWWRGAMLRRLPCLWMHTCACGTRHAHYLPWRTFFFQCAGYTVIPIPVYRGEATGHGRRQTA